MKLYATTEKVTIKWFVYAGEEKIAHNATMRGAWGYDAECSCGWKTVTGGAIKSSVQSEVASHKYIEHKYTYSSVKAGA